MVDLPDTHLPAYPDIAQRDTALAQVRQHLPIVNGADIFALREHIAAAGRGEAFIVQGGDCAERFADVTRFAITAKIGALLQSSFIIGALSGSSLPVIPIGRIAGQYAKPRTNAYEERDGLTLLSYRGDAVNSPVFTAQGRTPDPQRLVQAADNAARTYEIISDLERQGFADSCCAQQWNTAAEGTSEYQRFLELVEQGNRPVKPPRLYISHEALLPLYEQACTDSERLNRGAHTLWVGDRTRAAESPQLRYIASIENPVAVKLGPTTSVAHIRQLIDQLNPTGQAGRLSFIVRMGREHIAQVLAPLMEAVRADGRPVTWLVDPMHGNTVSSNGQKMRFMTDILEEIEQFFHVCAATGTVPGGVHIEFSGHNVTEISDFAGQDQTHIDESLVDPRLNATQLLRVAFQVGQQLP